MVLFTFLRNAPINFINNVLRLPFVRGKCLTESKIRLFYTICPVIRQRNVRLTRGLVWPYTE